MLCGKLYCPKVLIQVPFHIRSLALSMREFSVLVRSELFDRRVQRRDERVEQCERALPIIGAG